MFSANIQSSTRYNTFFILVILKVMNRARCDDIRQQKAWAVALLSIRVFDYPPLQYIQKLTLKRERCLYLGKWFQSVEV